jgi:hypothetical protein
MVDISVFRIDDGSEISRGWSYLEVSESYADGFALRKHRRTSKPQDHHRHDGTTRLSSLSG